MGLRTSVIVAVFAAGTSAALQAQGKMPPKQSCLQRPWQRSSSIPAMIVGAGSVLQHGFQDGAALFKVSATAFADTKATFTLPSGVNVTITEAPFDRKLFKVSGCTDTSATCLINGHFPAGVPFGLPKTYVKQISVSYRGRSYSLDAEDMYDAWGTRPLEVKGVIRYFGGKCFDQRNCQFRGIFSDAAATFAAEWAVVDGLPVRTVLSGSDDIVSLFMKHIDPPEFK